MQPRSKVRSVPFVLLPFALLTTLLLCCFSDGHLSRSAANASDPMMTTDHPAGEKQKGVHLFGRLDTTFFPELKKNNIEWITLVSWAYQEDISSAELNHHNQDSEMIRRRDSSWLHRMQVMRAAGFKLFVKPHVWISKPTDGKWRSDIQHNNETDWQQWQKNYRDFILHYATLAETAGAEMFCIGTELTRLSIGHPAFWQQLIRDLRQVYSGKLTYAANWYEEYENITFWDQLDYIGIQAYFPLAKKTEASFREICRGWKDHLPAMKKLHKKFNKKIIFTEMGYKSTIDGAIKPWEWMEHTTQAAHLFSEKNQADCYRAFFEMVWPQDWLAGVHIWQFRADYNKWKTDKNLDFTPQGKMAEQIIARGFE